MAAGQSLPYERGALMKSFRQFCRNDLGPGFITVDELKQINVSALY
jgi:hypothetical protein